MALISRNSISNWAGNVVFTPQDVLRPRDIAEAQQFVAHAPRIRALGTGHSFNDIADAPQLISLGDLAASSNSEPFELDETARTVTVPGAAPYGAVAAFLQKHGWALHNLGSLPHISVAGATATATHGSGDRNGVLSTAVRGIERIGADGELTWVRAGEPDFDGSVVALGALGINTRITLAIEPTYDMTQQVYTGLRWDTFLDEFDEIMAAAYSVSVLGLWSAPTLSTLWLKSRGDVADAAPQLFGGDRVTAEVHAIIPGAAPVDNMTPLGTSGSWSGRLSHFRFDRDPSAGGDEIQSEFFVPRATAVDALRALRPLGDRLDPLLHVNEFRTFAGDDLWLSGGEGGGRLAIHFTWHQRPSEVAALLPEIEAELRPFTPRAHWGKVYSTGFDQAAGFRRLGDFRALMMRVDPTGKFRNNHLDRVLAPEQY